MHSEVALKCSKNIPKFREENRLENHGDSYKEEEEAEEEIIFKKISTAIDISVH